MDSFVRDLIQNNRRKKHFAGDRGVQMGDQQRMQRRVTTSAHGFHALYLGKVPTHHSNDEDHTQLCVDKLLDICNNMNETFIDEVYLDIKSFALIMHYVDITSKVIDTKLFDLARISYCSAGHFEDPRLFAWIYRQETEAGFQLECHAVRCKTIRKTRVIVYQLYDAMTKLFVEVQAALQASESFKSGREKTAGEPSSKTSACSSYQVGKTVRFDDFVQRIDFEVEESLSEGDDSVFYDNEDHPASVAKLETSPLKTETADLNVSETDDPPASGDDSVKDENSRRNTCELEAISDTEEEEEEENATSDSSVFSEEKDEVAELSCPCTPLLSPAPPAHYRVVEVDNPCFQGDELDESEDGDEESGEDTEEESRISSIMVPSVADFEETEDSASSGFGEDDQDSAALNCFEDIAL